MQEASESDGLPISLDRHAPPQALQPFTDYFEGFEKVAAVRKVFGEETEKVLAGLKVGFISNRRMYMGIRDHDGNIAVGTYHLRHSPKRVIYLDIVHELFHIKQWMGDKDWFTKEHEKFMGDSQLYYVSPLEVPAYEHTVREAERLGMTPGEITEYLKMMPVRTKVWKGFLKKMELEGGDSTPRRATEARLPVKINRKPKLVLHPFTDYFRGFEDAEPVKALFGRQAEEKLGGLKVEFLESPFGSIFPSEEDGHLVVNSEFLKEADVESIYLDVILSLSLLQSAERADVAQGSEEGFGATPQVIESYKTMVVEGRRIGLTDSKIMARLQLPRFMMSEAAFRSLVRVLGLKSD